MIRQVGLDKFPKKTSTFRAQILSNITLHQRRPFDPSTPKLIARDTTTNIIYQLYIIRKLNPLIKQSIEFIQHTPNILLLQRQPYSLIFEQQCQQTLKQFLSRHQSQTGLPYINEPEAREIIFGVLESLQSFEKNNLQYQCLTDDNVVRLEGNNWMLSLASAVGNCFAADINFYDARRKGKQTLFYALGTLLFKLLFGFVPFEDNAKKPAQFKLSTYIDSLEQQSTRKLLKVYYFVDRIQLISQRSRLFIEDCLSGNIMSFEQLKHHAYLTLSLESAVKKQFIENKEIKMLNYFQKKYHSLIMAAIQRRRKYPHEKLHPRMEGDVTGFLQLRDIFAKDSYFNHLSFVEVKTQSELKHQEDHHNNLKIQCKYFDNQFDFKQKQRPTLQLIKFIDRDRANNPDLYQKQDRQARIKLYAYPYTMVFELANVYSQQPVQLRKKIQQLIPYLLEVSSLHWPIDRLPCLHQTKQRHTKFEEIKLKYRQLINLIYQHFLTEAMRRYNSKKQNLTVTEKIKLKEEGLEYYRLCLKLMEASLIVRKGGRQLDLQRIQTSQRKEIQLDLENILKTYFPSRVEIK